MPPFHYDNSMIEDMFCKQFFCFRHICHLVPNRGNIYLEYGIAVHEGLRAFYEQGSVNAAIATATSFPLTDQNQSRNYQTLDESIRKYCGQFPIQTDYLEPVILNEKKCLEISFTIPLSDTYIYCGNIDLFARDRRDGSYAIVDHKTTWRITQLEITGFEMKTQFPGYCLGASVNFNFIVNRAYINAITTARKIEITRLPFVYSQERLQRTLKHLDTWGREMKQLFDIFPNREDGTSYEVAEVLDHPSVPACRACCTRYMSDCRYMPLCVRGQDAIGEYRREKWNPLERRTE
jgi:hypothetical protein